MAKKIQAAEYIIQYVSPIRKICDPAIVSSPRKRGVWEAGILINW
jgi:hypothetical protein